MYRAEDGRILERRVDLARRARSASPTDGHIRLLSPIPDLARTEVFVGRGFAALTIG